jgi:hypothetical protein
LSSSRRLLALCAEACVRSTAQWPALRCTRLSPLRADADAAFRQPSRCAAQDVAAFALEKIQPRLVSFEEQARGSA